MPQADRILKTRILEHCNDIRRNTSLHSVIIKQLDHDFDWESTEIVDQDRFCTNDSEMLYLVAKK